MPDYPSQFQVYSGQSINRSSIGGSALPPSQKDIPESSWYTQAVPFQWTATASDGTGILPPGWIFTWVWRSAIYDLRPGLLADNAGPKDGVPIWPKSGRMYVMVYQTPATQNRQAWVNSDNLNVLATDWLNATYNISTARGGADAVNPNQGAALYRDITRNASYLFNNSFLRTVLMAGFSPPGTVLGFGDGHPIRYWRLQLSFGQFVETGFPVPVDPSTVSIPLVLQASVY